MGAMAIRLDRVQITSTARRQYPTKGEAKVRTKAVKPTTLGSVSLGAKFVFRTVEILGRECANTNKPPFEGKMLTVVEFKPRYVNQVLAQDSQGYQCLLPLSYVEKALKAQRTLG